MRGGDREQTDYILVGASGSGESTEYGIDQVALEDRRRGRLQIGWHYVIDRDGGVQTGRPESLRAGLANGAGMTAVAVCLLGGTKAPVDGAFSAAFSQAQRDALRPLVQDLLARYPKAKVLPDWALNPAACGPIYNPKELDAAVHPDTKGAVP